MNNNNNKAPSLSLTKPNSEQPKKNLNPLD